MEGFHSVRTIVSQNDFFSEVGSEGRLSVGAGPSQFPLFSVFPLESNYFQVSVPTVRSGPRPAYVYKKSETSHGIFQEIKKTTKSG